MDGRSVLAVSRAGKFRWGWALGTSAILHAVLLAVFCWPMTPVFVKPRLVARGEGGTSTPRAVTLILPPDVRTVAPAPLSLLSLPRSPHQAEEKKKLTKRSNLVETDKPADSLQAGSVHGSSLDGPIEGDEIKPGFAISFREPGISRWDLPSGLHGEVVVEVTIDAEGNVVEEKLLHGVGHGVDEKVIAAIQGWHFQPATRNGVPIPSKHDVLYPLPN
jgi:protein TonB